MGFLNPWFLLAGTAVLVPLCLHLFFRRESKTFAFPAIRYLLRTERERASRIRAQQLLLLLLRAAIVVLLTTAGARAHFRGEGRSHEPTAVALVLDNSMSTTVVAGGRRHLDTLKAAARISVADAGPDDVIWVIGAGTPWKRAVPGGAAQALAAVGAVRPTHGRAEMVEVVDRARALVAQSGLPAREVHVFTDLQATGFEGVAEDIGSSEAPVVVFGLPAGGEAGVANRGVGRVIFGGGLAPLAGRRTRVSALVSGGPPADTATVRLYVEDQFRVAGRAPVGAAATLPTGPFGRGRIEGWVEIDPDPLAADDRRHFSLAVREPPLVAVAGEAPLFVREAIAVLDETNRLSVVEPGVASVLVSAGGEGLDATAAGRSGAGRDRRAVIFPLAEAALLPALNRALDEAGIPFRYVATGGGSGVLRLQEHDLPIDLGEIEVRRRFAVEPAGGGPAPASYRVLATLTNGDPWLWTGVGDAGRAYVLIASPLDETSTSLPLSATMLPLIEWAVEHGTGAHGEATAAVAGKAFVPTPAATTVVDPEGGAHRVDGDQPFFAAIAGLHRAMAGDSVLETVAVNPPAAETDLTPLSQAELEQALPGTAAVVADAGDWGREIFRARRGREPWQLLALALLALALVESGAAASARVFSRSGSAAGRGPVSEARA